MTEPGENGWLVKDFADGWIFCATREEADREARGAGNLVVDIATAPENWSLRYKHAREMAFHHASPYGGGLDATAGLTVRYTIQRPSEVPGYRGRHIWMRDGVEISDAEARAAIAKAGSQ